MALALALAAVIASRVSRPESLSQPHHVLERIRWLRPSPFLSFSCPSRYDMHLLLPPLLWLADKGQISCLARAAGCLLFSVPPSFRFLLALSTRALQGRASRRMVKLPMGDHTYSGIQPATGRAQATRRDSRQSFTSSPRRRRWLMR